MSRIWLESQCAYLRPIRSFPKGLIEYFPCYFGLRIFFRLVEFPHLDTNVGADVQVDVVAAVWNEWREKVTLIGFVLYCT